MHRARGVESLAQDHQVADVAFGCSRDAAACLDVGDDARGHDDAGQHVVELLIVVQHRVDVVLHDAVPGRVTALTRIPDSVGLVRVEAAEFYDWLIRPIEPSLANPEEIEALVFISAGPLRGIPMAALWDREEKRYLVERL
ncbi:MAG: CHAT domain-containing protein, partial [Deltaproteobacteria bacterium]|nr:CHAT domain-containing protein [Deltaproteobacteria bacterium]